MKEYICCVCGFVYNESEGLPKEGIPPGTKWEDLPEDFACPACAASKSMFKVKE